MPALVPPDAAAGFMILSIFSARSLAEGGGIFGDLFGENRRDPGGPERGSDLRYDMEVSFEEAVLGSEKEISVTKLETCETCRGSGAEAGVEPENLFHLCEERVKSSARGGIFSIARTCPRCEGVGRLVEKPCHTCRGAGRKSALQRSRLRSRLAWIPAHVFAPPEMAKEACEADRPEISTSCFMLRRTRSSNAKTMTSFVRSRSASSRLLLGQNSKIPTLTGRASIRIPSGTQSGTVFRLKGKGVKNIQGYGSGDLHVRVIVEGAGRI